MKARINKDGRLIVTSANDTEDFALIQWKRLFGEGHITIEVDVGSHDPIAKYIGIKYGKS